MRALSLVRAPLVVTAVLAAGLVLVVALLRPGRPAWEGGLRQQSPYHGTTVATTDGGGVRPPGWAADEPIYEADVRHYTASGTLAEFTGHLPELRSLGVGVVWLMPIFPRGVERAGGSPYAVRHQLAIDPAVGTGQDFERLVDQAHKLGMHVILDFVVNHTSWDHPWIKAHPDWYQRDASGEIRSPTADWTDVAQLDFSNAAMRTEMIRALTWWVRDGGVDGFRFDAAWNVPPDFFAQARTELQKVKPVLFLAEADDPAYHPVTDMTYAWDLPDLYADVAAGRKPAADIDAYLAWERRTFPAGAMRLRYVTNHDIAHDSTRARRYRGGADAFTVVTTTLPGTPLVYNGQESGLDVPLDERTRVTTQPNFAADRHRPLMTRLLDLYRDNQALSRGRYAKLPTDHDQSVFAFARRHGTATVLTIANLCAEARTVTIQTGGYEGAYTDVFSGTPARVEASVTLRLPPWGFRILQRPG